MWRWAKDHDEAQMVTDKLKSVGQLDRDFGLFWYHGLLLHEDGRGAIDAGVYLIEDALYGVVAEMWAADPVVFLTVPVAIRMWREKTGFRKPLLAWVDGAKGRYATALIRRGGATLQKLCLEVKL